MVGQSTAIQSTSHGTTSSTVGLVGGTTVDLVTVYPRDWFIVDHDVIDQAAIDKAPVDLATMGLMGLFAMDHNTVNLVVEDFVVVEHQSYFFFVI